MDHRSRIIVIGWKIVLVVLAGIGLSTGLVKTPGFWTSYVLDIAAPPWNYILIRGLFTSKKTTFFSIKFKPETAALLIIGIACLIETAQYFKIYAAHFDPYDYIAYISLLLPCYLIDKFLKGR